MLKDTIRNSAVKKSKRCCGSGELQSPFLNRQGRQERQGKCLLKQRSTSICNSCFLGVLGVLGVLGGFLLFLRLCSSPVLRMEFATYRQAMINVPAQIIRSGRKLIYRLLSWNRWQEVFFRLWTELQHPLRC